MAPGVVQIGWRLGELMFCLEAKLAESCKAKQSVGSNTADNQPVTMGNGASGLDCCILIRVRAKEWEFL